MAFDWSQLQWDPTQSFALPTESQLARGLLADAGKGSENKFAPTAQNLALLQSLGYGGQGFSQAPTSEETAGASLPIWADDARNWLSNNGYNVGVAHLPNTSAGGRPEFFGLTGPDGKFVNGQSDPTMTNSDTLMDQVGMFATLLGPMVGMAGAAGGAAGGGADAIGAGAGLGSGAVDYASLFEAMPGYVSDAGTGLSGAASGLAPGVAVDYAPAFMSMPEYMGATGAGVGAGSGLADTGGNSLVQNQTNTFWDKLKSGAEKGAIKGGITSGIKGDNPLKGAVMGGLTGAIGGGISSIGDGSLGNAMSLDNSSGGMGLIPGGFDTPTDTSSIINNLGSFGDGAASTGGNMGWTDWLSGMDPSGGWMSGAQPPDLGSFGDPQTTNWGNGGGFDLSGVDMGGYGGGDYSLTPTDGGSGLDWNSILNGVKSGVGAISGAVGGGQNLAALIGAGLGAASGGGTQTSSRDPWSAAQPYLKNLLGDADAMRANLQQNPFTPQQTQAYQNAYGGLDQARAALPGLLNWGQNAMQRQSTVPSYAQLFGGGQPMQPAQPAQMPGGLLGQQPQFGGPQPTMQAGGPGGLLGTDDRMKALMAKGRSLIG